jgi:hypothetical protein
LFHALQPNHFVRRRRIHPRRRGRQVEHEHRLERADVKPVPPQTLHQVAGRIVGVQLPLERPSQRSVMFHFLGDRCVGVRFIQ